MGGKCCAGPEKQDLLDFSLLKSNIHKLNTISAHCSERFEQNSYYLNTYYCSLKEIPFNNKVNVKSISHNLSWFVE